MRISDWSSDVCSSDLQYRDDYPGHAAWLFPGFCPGPGHVRGGLGLRGPGLGRHDGAAAIRNGALGAVARKSVVSGKMSVRVDLGGRSILKKKRLKSIDITVSIKAYGEPIRI